MSILVLVRHGESQFNLENRFTGWLDVPLSDKGIVEAVEAGMRIKSENIHLDKVYTSPLQRSTNSLEYVLKMLGQTNVELESDAALNERHYGDLQGLNKSEAAKKFGEKQVKVWRRSYDVAPPNGESLKDTAARVLPYFHSRIMADIEGGKNVLVMTHGNSLRCIVMELDHLDEKQVEKLEIPTGVPMIYSFDKENNISKKELR
jgi:2,3-bisphosphoglycerate-dependent phosphoglycerate mutase